MLHPRANSLVITTDEVSASQRSISPTRNSVLREPKKLDPLLEPFIGVFAKVRLFAQPVSENQ